MAKNKKEMTPEERLAAALVPEEEQPYELPKGWKWVRIGKIFIDVTDSQKKIKQKEYLLKGKWPVIDQGQHFIGGYSDADELIYTDELPVIIFGDHTRNVKYIDFQFIQGADGVKVLKPQSFIYSKFLFWLLKGIPFPSLGYRRHFPVLKKMVAPLPPLDEQQRLVARIESLFAKLDAAKAKVQAVLDAHETRKAALLDEAFRGKLTETLDETSTAEDFLDEIYAVKAQLVKEKKIKKPKRLPSMTDEEKPFEIPNTWRWVRFGDILRIINGDRGKNYPSKKELHEAGDIPFISALNIQDNTIATEHLLYVDEERYNLLRSGKLKKGDLVLCIRGSLGKNGRYPFDRGAIASSLVIIRSYLDNDAMYDYISFYLDSLLFKNEMSKYDNGTAQPNLGAGDLSLFAVPLPPLAEQHEIVAILDRLLGREEEVRQSAESVLAAIDSMKQSILARAFRGELGA